MANVLKLKHRKSNNFWQSYPLQDDIFVEAQSQFSSFGELIPKIQGILQMATSLGSMGGVIGAGLLEITNKLDVPRWQKTDPIRLTAKLVFHTQSNSREDVLNPMYDIMELTMLSDSIIPGQFEVPGINLKNLNKIKAPGKDPAKISISNDKLVAISIPDIMTIPLALVKTAKPTWSKEKTKSGPLWGILDCQFEGLFPAHINSFRNATSFLKDTKAVIGTKKEEIKIISEFIGDSKHWGR